MGDLQCTVADAAAAEVETVDAGVVDESASAIALVVIVEKAESEVGAEEVEDSGGSLMAATKVTVKLPTVIVDKAEIKVV